MRAAQDGRDPLPKRVGACMWLKKLVGLSMLITLIGMNAIVLVGFFGPDKSKGAFELTQTPIALPSITLSADPPETTAGMFSALKWQATGDITRCTASGDWSGPKTPFGSESTGRLPTEGTRTYTLVCENKAGKSQPATATVAVKPAAPIAAAPAIPSAPTPATTPTKTAAVYCDGASPCYGPREVAAHSGAGNCWGWNGTRVINISGFDTSYHKAKSGIGTIEVGGVCGKDLASSLGGGVSADGQTRNHNSATKSNADRNMIPYFVGYFDSAKP